MYNLTISQENALIILFVIMGIYFLTYGILLVMLAYKYAEIGQKDK